MRVWAWFWIVLNTFNLIQNSMTFLCVRSNTNLLSLISDTNSCIFRFWIHYMIVVTSLFPSLHAVSNQNKHQCIVGSISVCLSRLLGVLLGWQFHFDSSSFLHPLHQCKPRGVHWVPGRGGKGVVKSPGLTLANWITTQPTGGGQGGRFL